MKLFTRITTLVLALLMVCAMVVACANNPDDPADTTPSGNVADSSNTDDPNADPNAGLYDEDGYLKDDLPEDLKYNNAEVMVLHWNAERDEFVSEGQTGDNIMDAIWSRNVAIEERLGVTLKFEECEGNTSNVSKFVQKVANSFSAGEKVYDIIATYSRTAGDLAYKGYYADLNAIDENYINLEKPWWPEALTSTASVGDSLYFVSGDVSVNTLHFMYTIYYNQQLMTNLGLTDPTEYVLNHTWTLDKLIEMSSEQYQDLDQDSKQSDDDFYGFTTIYYGADAFYTGSGLKIIESTGDDDLLKISDDYFGEKAINLVEKLGAWLTTDSCYVSNSGAAVSFAVPFVNGNALFCQNRVYLADNKHSSGLNDVDWKYGLVPTPLYDENQEDYITVIGNPFTLYGIMTDCDEQSRMTAVIECWASEGYRKTTPALFYTNMKYKYTQLDVSAQMFDILRETQSYDMGRILGKSFASIPSELPSKAACEGRSWASQARSLQKTMPKQLNTIIEGFQKIQSQS